MLTARQQHCLRGIGIRTWRDRHAVDGEGNAADDQRAAAVEAESVTVNEDQVPALPAASSAAPAAVEADGVGAVEKTDAGPAGIALDGPPSFASWDGLIDAIHACTACELSQNCTRKVPGVGNARADLLIVGEGPGHDEDIQGEPFVGRSGQLLDRMLAAIGLDRQQVYITNIVKCRPPNNRDPRPEEALQCRAYLEAQIERIAPRVILSVGRVSAHNLLGSDQPVGKLIRQRHTLPGSEIPVKVTYHPAYLLRNPSAKAIAWQDLKLLHQMLQ